MRGTVGRWLDLVLLVMLAIYAVANLGRVLRAADEPIVYNLGDKSLLYVDASIYLSDETETLEDVIYALAVIDDFIPYPNVIQVGDTPEIVITAEWVANKAVYLNRICSETGDWRFYSQKDRVVTKDIIFKADGTAVLKYTFQ